MDATPQQLRDRFVVEVGVRQAWPYITFCDASATPTTEIRLYIDSTFRLEPGTRAFDDGDPTAATEALLDLNNRTVVDVGTNDHHDLTLRFDDGARTLTISGTPAAFTTHDAWWLATALPPPRRD